jgi:pentose-5-phosphate-3-epimerase
MVKAYVSINGARELSGIGRALEAAVSSGADGLHFDVIDGSVGGQPATLEVFNPKYLGDVREYAEKARRDSTFPISVHLLVSKPFVLAAQYMTAGASRIILPYKAFNSTDALLVALKQIRDDASFDRRKMRIGVSFSPPECKQSFDINKTTADFIDIVASGPGFDMAPAPPLLADVVREAYRQIDPVRTKYRLEFEIVVQGGITPRNTPEIKKAGADILILGRDFVEMKSGHAAYIESVKRV